MKLTPRTTYRDRLNEPVHIAGPCGYDVDGEPVFWSIQGNHYTESGRLVLHNFHKDPMGNYVDDKFTHQDYRENIVRLDHDPEWWKGVKT